jgi:carbon-monoxide dehydrogenase medium subunit
MRTSPRLVLAESLEQAVGELAGEEGDAMVVAGGTAVSIMLHHRLITPSALVSLTRVPGLREISLVGGVIRLGALVTHHEVARSEMVTRELPVLVRTFGVVANHRVRAAATVGGVLAEADYASDPPTTLAALDAAVVIVGPAGERRLPVAELTTGYYETSLGPGEIITGVEIPVPAPGTAGEYHKYRSTGSEDRPCVGVAAVVRLDGDGTCSDLRVCVGAASAIPLRLAEVEQGTRGQLVDAGLAGRVGEAYAAAIRPISDVRGSAWYRREVIRALVSRALLSCAREPDSQKPPRTAIERETDEL